MYSKAAQEKGRCIKHHYHASTAKLGWAIKNVYVYLYNYNLCLDDAVGPSHPLI